MRRILLYQYLPRHRASRSVGYPSRSCKVLVAIAGVSILASCLRFPRDIAILFEGLPPPPRRLPSSSLLVAVQDGGLYIAFQRVAPTLFVTDPANMGSVPNPAAGRPFPPLHWSVHGTWTPFKAKGESLSFDWRPIRWGSYGFGNAYEEPRTDWVSVPGSTVAFILLLACFWGSPLNPLRRRRGFQVVPSSQPVHQTERSITRGKDVPPG
jgi:hypothetical protein